MSVSSLFAHFSCFDQQFFCRCPQVPRCPEELALAVYVLLVLATLTLAFALALARHCIHGNWCWSALTLSPLPTHSQKRLNGCAHRHVLRQGLSVDQQVCSDCRRRSLSDDGSVDDVWQRFIVTLSQTRVSAVPTEQRGPCTFSHLCPYQPVTIRSTSPAFSPASEDCTFGTSAAVLLLCWSHAPFAQCVVPHLPSASPESDTGVLCPESVLGPRSQCPSLLLPVASQGIDHHTHHVRSELEVPLLPSRFFTAEGWWLAQPGVQDVRRGLRTSCPRCRAPCLLQSLDLCRELADSLLVFNSAFPILPRICSCPLEPWLCGDLFLTTLRRDSGSSVSFPAVSSGCLPRETLRRPRSARQGFVILQRTSSTMLTDVFYTRLNSSSLELRHRCASVVTLIRTVTTRKKVQNVVINVLMRIAAELKLRREV